MMNEDEEMPDTQPADDLTQSQSQDVISQPQDIWGQLVPSAKRFKDKGPVNLLLIRLIKDVYTAGRGFHCDLRFSADCIPNPTLLSVVSKLHFQIIRQTINNRGDKVIYLEDNSANGTFVNKKLVGKGNKVVLDNNDVISLAKTEFTVFTFISLQVYEKSGLPEELRPKYAALRILGSGACGEVKMVFSKNCYRTFAIKAIAKHQPTLNGHKHPLNDPDKIMNEVRILQALKNPFIIKMEEIIDTSKSLYIVLELMEGGELFDRIRAAEGLPEKQAKFIFCQIVHAVNYLHNQGITHRDLKPENILLASDDEYPLVKVSDFGLSKLVDAQTMMKTFCGTPMYVAPEILKTGGRGAYTNQVDVWSLGVILYVTLSGYVPFSDKNKDVPLYEQITRGVYQFPPAKFAKITKQAKNLIKGMMTVNARMRKTIREVMIDVWLQDREMRLIVNKVVKRYNNENATPNIPTSAEPERAQVPESTIAHVFGVPAPMAKRPRIE